MTKIKFEDFVGKTPAPQVNTQWRTGKEETQEMQVSDILAETSNFENALDLYTRAYVNKKRCEDLYKAAAGALDMAKEKLVEEIGYENFEDDRIKVEQVERKGSIDWKLVEYEHPGVELDKFRKAKTFYWTIKVKPNLGAV